MNHRKFHITVTASTAMLTALAITAALAGCDYGGPTVGANNVLLDLHCEEDEVIAFDQSTPAPHPLACVNIDVIRGGE